LVLTFDFAFGKLQREHPHKLSDYIVKERSPDSGVRLPRREASRRKSKWSSNQSRPTIIQATGALMTALGCLYVLFWSLAWRHRPPSEQRIIAANCPRSTN